MLALALNVLADLAYLRVFENNNFLYNIISIVRLFSFMWFFSFFYVPRRKNVRSTLFFILACLILLNFTILESFKNFSSNIFTLEGIVLLSYSVIYFLKKLKSEELSSGFDASLYIVTALAIYEAVCFPIFLFFDTLMKNTEDYAVDIWGVHNIAYIVFCLFIARAFYGSSRHANN